MLKPIILTGEQKNVLFLPPTEPIQIKGVAGSGKTTVALYRAKHLIETQSNLFRDASVAIFTYNKTLVQYILAVKNYISGGFQKDSDNLRPNTSPGLNVEVTNFHKWAYRFLTNCGMNLYGKIIKSYEQKNVINSLKIKHQANNSNITQKRAEFFIEEISWIKGKLLKDVNEYMNAKRTGRGTGDRVTNNDKLIIWKIYEGYERYLIQNENLDFDDYAILALKEIDSNRNFIHPFTHIVVDEAQDLNKAQILVLTKIVSPETKSLSIIADAAQRIYKSGFTWSEVGINVRGGRTIEFKKNYRNTVPIARAALSLLDNETDKQEFTTVETAMKGDILPTLGYFNNWESQVKYLASLLNELNSLEGISSTVLLHRNTNGINNINQFVQTLGYDTILLRENNNLDFEADAIKICTLSSIKGLEFDNVIIVDLNDDVIPYPPGFNDENDEYHISTERRLLYTAMTRAKERLYLLSSGNPSRYLSEIDAEFVDIIDGSSKIEDEYDNDLPF